MCTPAAIALTLGGIQAAQGVSNYFSAKSQAKATARAASEAAQQDYEALSLQARQISAKGAAEGLAIKREAMQTRGTLAASQAGAGVAGASPLREVLNVRLKEQEALAQAEGNTGDALLQNRMDMNKIRATAQSRANEAYARVPNPLLAGLQIATSGLQGASVGYDLGQKIQKGKAANG